MTRSGESPEGATSPVVPLPVRPLDRARMGLHVQGRYRIASELGAGAFGTVCLADDEATTHQVAIRFLPGDPAGVARAAHAVRRRGRSIVEASAAHPALVRVLEFGEVDNGQAFVVMEVAPGRRLSEILAQGPLDVATALRWAIELGGAVETLHNMGIVHGALRPRNVKIGEDGSVKLMDVELTDLRDELARTGIVTTEAPPEYLAPEQIRRGPVSEKTDVYAFAVVLYEMLCGVPPFRAEAREATLAKHLTEAPIPMRRRRHAIPASVASMVALALSKRPDQRPLIHNLLNSLWQEANVPATRWKRTAAIVGSIVLAASVPVVVGWGLLTPHPSVAPLPAAPTPPPVAVQAPPPKPSPTPSAIRPETRPAPPAHAATPAAAAPAAATPEPARATPAARPEPARATPAAITPEPARATAPPASPAASRTPTPERREQTRAPETPTKPAPDQAPTSNSNGDPDPGAVVDWLLERAAARRGK